MGEQTNILYKILHFIPLLRPIHVLLNTCKTCLLTFHPFFNALYKDVFQKKRDLVAKPNLGKLIYFYILLILDGYLYILIFFQNLIIQRI